MIVINKVETNWLYFNLVKYGEPLEKVIGKWQQFYYIRPHDAHYRQTLSNREYEATLDRTLKMLNFVSRFRCKL